MTIQNRQFARSVLAAVIFLGGAIGCTKIESPASPSLPPPVARALEPSAQNTPPEPVPSTAAESVAPQSRRKSEFYFGADASGAAQTRASSVGLNGDEVTLKFINADVREVIREVLGETLHVAYAIDPKIQGTTTLQTSGPVGRAELLSIFEDALRLNGIALVKTNDVYNVVQIAEALRYAPISGPGDSHGSGYSIQIIPLKYVSSDEIQNVARGIVPQETMLRSIASQNVLLVAGSQREIASIANLVSTFDVDQMRGMSFALFYPRYTDAKTAIRELETIFAGDKNAPIGIRFLPIERINAVLAISRSSAYLRTAATWFDRLDQGGQTADDRIFVYYVQNGRAVNLAATLNSLFSGNSARNTGSSLSSPVTPLQSTPGPSVQPPTSPSSPPSVASRDEGIRLTGTRKPQIIADETNNALLVLATPRDYEVIQAALAKLDLPPLQVMIEAVVAEVTLNNELRYGVQWFFQPGAQSFTLSRDAQGNTSPEFPGFAAVLGTGNRIRVVLDALESLTRVNVLSSPQLMVLNNQTATLQVGDQVPIATQSATSVLTPNAPIVNTIQFRDTGVILHVTPRVNEGGLVQLDINQEVSDVTKTTTSGIDSPTIQQRKFNSSVSVQNGETIALGGLIRDRRTQIDSGIPLLKDIPVFGNLFKDNSDVDGRTELVVLITPRVVRSQLDISRLTDEFRERLRALQAPEQP